MSALDARMFGKDWWVQPLAARFASVDACKVGLTVSIELARISSYYKSVPCIIWRGTAEQFAATATFPNGVAAKSSRGKWVTPGPLRGTVYPAGEGRFAFVIAGVYADGKRDIKFHAQKAIADENYLNFRDAVMAGFPLADPESISNGDAL